MSGAIAGAVASVAVIAVLVLIALWYRRRRDRQKQAAMARTEMEFIDTVVRRPEIVALELLAAHIKFRERLGEGEFGEVFCADVTLDSVAVVAAPMYSALI
eukprot:Opistho-2@20772